MRTRSFVEKLSETMIAFSLDAADPVIFLPGQYVNVLVPVILRISTYNCYTT